MNISPSNTFQLLLLLKEYHQNCHAVLAVTGMNGLTYSCQESSLTSVGWTRDLTRTLPTCLLERQFPENLLFGQAKISMKIFLF